MTYKLFSSSEMFLPPAPLHTDITNGEIIVHSVVHVGGEKAFTEYINDKRYNGKY